MPQKSLLLTVLSLFFSITTIADTTLPVIGNWENATQEGIWKKVDRNEVPRSLVVTEKIANPSKAYAEPYNTVFLQNERMVVCLETCDKKQKLRVRKVATGEFQINATDIESIRETNVYFWVNRLFDQLEAFGFKPTKRLIVIVDRDIADPASGVDMANNAFFNDGDWSLSFLPSARSLAAKLSGKNMGPSGNDASVAMHESSHAVFQQLIGDILNPEIYGLHEAFADYFAMMVLDSSSIGQVMLRGKPLRKADEIIPYKTGMEAHDLGNVVSSALWKIRGLFSDKSVADRLALESVKTTGTNPYGSAGDLVSAHIRTARSLGISEIQISQIVEVWRESGLAPFDFSKINPKLIVDAPLDREVMQLKISIEIPLQAQKEFGLTNETLVVRKGESRSEEWTHFSVTSSGAGSTTDAWVFYSPSDSGIHTAVRVGTSEVILAGTPDMSNLIKLNSAMKEIVGETADGKFGANAQELFTLKSLIMAAVNERQTGTPTVVVNGRTLQAKVLTRDIKVKLFAKLLGSLVGPELKAMLKAVRQVSLITVPAGAFSSPKLPIYPGNNETIIGYQIVSGGGITETVMLEEIQ